MQFYRRLYSMISSMKTGLFLLFLIALLSALGSVILPENFFQNPVFIILFILLLVNMVMCTMGRVIRTRWSNLRTSRVRLIRDLGLLFLHLGILLIIAGAGVYLIFGQSATIEMSQGDSVDVSTQIKISKPLSIDLENFLIEYNDDGSASQYYSQVNAADGNQEKLNFIISVNHPLKYQNIKVYQQSFGYKVGLQVTESNEKGPEILLYEGETLIIPETERAIKIFKYIPNYDPDYGANTKTLRPDNPYVMFSVYEKDTFMGVGVAKIGEHIKLTDTTTVTFGRVEPYTVLRIKADPGLSVTGIGGILFMFGVSMSLPSANRKPKQKAAARVHVETGREG